MSDDAVFWERIAGMPMLEAEQELVLRREQLVQEAADLLAAKGKAESRGNGAEANQLGREMQAKHATLTLIGERIKYLRRLQDSVSWRRAVTVLFGVEAYDACAAWLAENDEAAAFRKGWPGKAKA